MVSFLYDLKGQATVLNGLTILLVLAFILKRRQKKKAATSLVVITAFLFLLCSTSYLPHFLADKLERNYMPVSLPIKNSGNEKIFIYVLGSGYTTDKRLPANAQIGLVALGRLAEGIRIHRTIENSVIICSGYSSVGFETQAQVTKRAAIVLGVDEDKLETLNTPTTTQEEAKDLGRIHEKSIKLIIVTDAMHMQRAIKLFEAQGFDPIPAPTNYKVNESQNKEGMRWWPSFSNISLMNYVIHEYLGSIKALIFK